MRKNHVVRGVDTDRDPAGIVGEGVITATTLQAAALQDSVRAIPDPKSDKDQAERNDVINAILTTSKTA